MVETGGKIALFDAGSGIATATRFINDPSIKEFDLFFSHVHLDHILGLPFFMPIWNKDVKIRIHAGTLKPYGGIEDFLKRTFHEPLFPVNFENFPAQITFHDFDPGETMDIGNGVNVRSCPLDHPNGAVGYRLNHNGKSVCYITDTEHPETGLDTVIGDFVKNTNLFIYDSSYENENYQKFKGWGHSTWQMCRDLAHYANVETFGIFHHDPSNNDEKMKSIEDHVTKLDPKAIVCKQGMQLHL